MRKVAEYREKYLHAARNLSVARRRAAGELEAAMKKELKDLAMPNALFEVSFRELEDDKGSAGGLEKIEFFLASNPGEAPRPLSRVASGGELSRIMLAVKALQVDGRGSPTVIFDERRRRNWRPYCLCGGNKVSAGSAAPAGALCHSSASDSCSSRSSPLCAKI